MSVMKEIQESLFPVFTKGQRVEVLQSAPTSVYGFGRIEAVVDQRRGWYYVRFPQGETEMVETCYLKEAPEEKGLSWTNKEGKIVPLRS